MADSTKKITGRNGADTQKVTGKMKAKVTANPEIKKNEVEHCMVIYCFGYHVIRHIPNKDLVFDLMPDIISKNKNMFHVTMRKKDVEKLGVSFTVCGFRTFCGNSFNTCLKEAMKQNVLRLPYLDKNGKPDFKEPFRTIMTTMKEWCKVTQQEGDIKGFVIHGYSLDDHLKQFSYQEKILENDFYNTILERKMKRSLCLTP